MRSLLIAALALTIISGCSKNGKNPCPVLYDTSPNRSFTTAYFAPVWHPNGEVIGFNYAPISGIKNEECKGRYYTYKEDSLGFYTINKDGSGLKRITKYFLFDPAWSPDGKSLVFSDHTGIILFPYSASGFDTTQKKRVTANVYDRHPTWTLNSDSIYYHSSSGSTSYNPVIAKAKIDGTGKSIVLAERGEQPSLGSDNFIYFINSDYQICRIDRAGANKEILTPEKNVQRIFPEFYNGKVYYHSEYKIKVLNGAELTNNAGEFAISSKGEIVYTRSEMMIDDSKKQNGVFWIMNADGTNNRQLTYNNY
ncbi:hypothetical protein HHL16_18825 [Pseudoflavitalea sp. G-6-1-2]|uniref:TolB family protein n=1 Tax=Pseudoflavitalea sp. G-6-1-2 TaxID=2728841 RepID=UPI00146CA4F6|nr:PD40 domain-containing protein [Pseudoflavitalea sp. G-6-1-2]NML22938.1 hypothetical protein [Pseudoflavitalea sp. G-6-1-2]